MDFAWCDRCAKQGWALFFIFVSLLATLILAPLITGLALLGIKSERLRRTIVVVMTAFLAVCSINLVWRMFPSDFTTFHVDDHLINEVMLGVEVLMAGYVIYLGVKHKRPLIVAFMLAQSALMIWFELAYGKQMHVGQNLFVDKFSIIMALINGVVGGLICVYALGYMKEYHEHHHPELKDRRPFLFGTMFIFLGAMFGLVFANNLVWFFFFWEITTLCSFFLIGYKEDE
jgi:ech hydrogenase subunit A